MADTVCAVTGRAEHRPAPRYRRTAASGQPASSGARVGVEPQRCTGRPERGRAVRGPSVALSADGRGGPARIQLRRRELTRGARLAQWM